ncbi:1680_t:CDS:2 [Entrophospora sp. SA101]|nr:1680_t:CDS:2 [Entrophospora sp. SA101]
MSNDDDGDHDNNGIGESDNIKPKSKQELIEIIKRIGAKYEEHVGPDTTHLICNAQGGIEYQRAIEGNIPIVKPEWLVACEKADVWIDFNNLFGVLGDNIKPKSKQELIEIIKRIGAKYEEHVGPDTTHLICNAQGGIEYQRAIEGNIPIVKPEWLVACEKADVWIDFNNLFGVLG